MSRNCGLYYGEAFQAYRFSPTHPFNPRRQVLAVSLAQACGILTPDDILAPVCCDEATLLSVHDEDMVAAVKAAGHGDPPANALRYGIGGPDNPAFPAMHEAASTIVGTSVTAMREVMEGRLRHAFNIGGGLHHARSGKVSGFCVYNDAAVAIQEAQNRYHAKVLYIDIDAHHGDGVQWIFYDDPQVCTLSIHESGKYLFPGSGSVDETGADDGRGFSVNVPLEPYTKDRSWLSCFRSVLNPVCEAFRPDLIVSQHGCDAHAWDPLTHLAASMQVYQESAMLIHDLAHRYCQGRWVALAGGGYDMWRVVPRAWTWVWAVMSERDVPVDVPRPWLNSVTPEAATEVPQTMKDLSDLKLEVPPKYSEGPFINEKQSAEVLNAALPLLRS